MAREAAGAALPRGGRVKAPPAVVTSASVDVRAVRRLVQLARACAENLEADKHRNDLQLVEVQLLDQADIVDDILKKMGC